MTLVALAAERLAAGARPEPPAAVVPTYLRDAANYVFERGDVIRDGDTIEGIEPGEKWRCLQEEALIPPDIRSERARSIPGAKRPSAGVASVPAEPEVPIDWSRIESALRPTGHGAREASRLVNKSEPKPPSAKGLSAHRQMLITERYQDSCRCFQFVKVSGPGIILKKAPGFFAQGRNWAAEFLRTFGEKLLRQNWDVFLTLP